MFRNVILLIFTLCSTNLFAQMVVNGNFDNQRNNWQCRPETRQQRVYGGGNVRNEVAEVDRIAGLCQTISGFTVGQQYMITFDATRRNSRCAPSAVSMNFSIDGGALPTQNIVRTGGFNFTQESFSFTATSTSHTINFVGTIRQTCGLIVDNIALAVMLPIELLAFELELLDSNKVQLHWETASEVNNDYFTIERSKDGLSWQSLSHHKGGGNSSTKNKYYAVDLKPLQGRSYYRLKQTDFNGQVSYSKIQAITILKDNQLLVYPNPTVNELFVENFKGQVSEISVLNIAGQDVSEFVSIHQVDSKLLFDFSQLVSGYYWVRLNRETIQLIKRN